MKRKSTTRANLEKLSENLHKVSIEAAWSDKTDICKENEMAIEFVLDLELWLCKKKEREGKIVAEKSVWWARWLWPWKFDLWSSSDRIIVYPHPNKKEKRPFSTIKFEYDQRTWVTNFLLQTGENVTWWTKLGNKGRVTNQQSSSFRFTSSRMTTEPNKREKQHKLDNFVTRPPKKNKRWRRTTHSARESDGANPTAWEQETFDSARINDEFVSSLIYFSEWCRGNMKIEGFGENFLLASFANSKSNRTRRLLHHSAGRDCAVLAEWRLCWLDLHENRVNSGSFECVKQWISTLKLVSWELLFVIVVFQLCYVSTDSVNVGR